MVSLYLQDAGNELTQESCSNSTPRATHMILYLFLFSLDPGKTADSFVAETKGLSVFLFTRCFKFQSGLAF